MYRISILFLSQILSVVDFLHTEMNKKRPDFNLAQDYVFKVWMPEVRLCSMSCLITIHLGHY